MALLKIDSNKASNTHQVARRRIAGSRVNGCLITRLIERI